MVNRFFTADTHFHHINIIKYCKRPFSDIKEMNEVLINNWNKKVKNKDIVYFLGDFGFYECCNILPRLNGSIILIKGNHDKYILKSKVKRHFKEIVDSKLLFLKDLNKLIVMCHYPLYIWEDMEFDSWHLHGHSHGIVQREGKVLDVGVDGNNFELYDLEEIIKIMENKPSNEVWVTKLAGFTKTEYKKYRRLSKKKEGEVDYETI